MLFFSHALFLLLFTGCSFCSVLLVCSKTMEGFGNCWKTEWNSRRITIRHSLNDLLGLNMSELPLIQQTSQRLNFMSWDISPPPFTSQNNRPKIRGTHLRKFQHEFLINWFIYKVKGQNESHGCSTRKRTNIFCSLSLCWNRCHQNKQLAWYKMSAQAPPKSPKEHESLFLHCPKGHWTLKTGYFEDPTLAI